MSKATMTILQPGKAYRTRELSRWGANPSRLAGRLVREGKLRKAAHGIYYAPVRTKFGPAPPDEIELLNTFLDGSLFIISGPPRWNPLGLGATAMFAVTLAYNTKRTGEFILGGRTFMLRRVNFPLDPSPEYYVVDLLEHHDMAGVSLPELEQALVETLRQGRWDRNKLQSMTDQFGTRQTLAMVERALATADATA